MGVITFLAIGAVIVIVGLLALAFFSTRAYKNQERQKKTEEFLSKPIEKLSVDPVEELAKKYENIDD